MLLRRLRDYSERLPLPPVMYLQTPVRWVIDLDAEGRLVNVISTPGEGAKGRGTPRLAPHVGRTVAVQAKLLADTAEYVLGIARDPEKQERVDRCHAAFVARVLDCAERTGEPAVRAVLRFLETLKREQFPRPDGFEAGAILTFRVEGEYPIDLPAVRAYWAAVAGGTGEAETAAEQLECLVCREERPPARNIPIKVKPIPGGQTSGMALVSTNAVAFESYGLNDISGAPICLDCGERFSKAANELIAGEDTHITIGPLVYIFWTREELDFGFGRMLSRPTAEDVRALFAAAWKADRAAAEEAEANRFYAAALSASGARVVVRDWLDTTVARARRNLVRYFALQELVKADGGESEPIGLYALAASTVRDVNKDLSARVPQAVLRVALTGGALPDWLLYQAVNRNRAERKVTRPRAALIKLTLLSQEGEGPTEERRMARVDLTNRTPAYLCGRLLAVMEAVQKAANRGIKATLTDRYFGTASSAPASVMGVLYRNHCRPHLSKLRKERPGVYNALDRRLQEVMQHLDTFPNTLTLKEQALFSLGYYHQRARDRAEATERKRLKEGKTGTAASKEK